MRFELSESFFQLAASDCKQVPLMRLALGSVHAAQDAYEVAGRFGIRVAKRTVQKYLKRGVQPRPSGQRWSTFLENHSKNIWACDFVQTYDIWFRPIFASFIINFGTREVVHVSATRASTQQWTAQQLRTATPFGKGPRFIIRDRDCKFGADFDRAAQASERGSSRPPCERQT